MKLSKRGEYGLRAMIDLARCGAKAKVVQIGDIAQREGIPVKFLEQIMLALKNAGLLRSKMGIGGGYYLARPADQILLGQIIRVLDGPLSPIGCVSQTSYEPCSCPDEKLCGLRMVMLDVQAAVSSILDQTTLEDVVQRVDRAHSSFFDLDTDLHG